MKSVLLLAWATLMTSSCGNATPNGGVTQVGSSPASYRAVLEQMDQLHQQYPTLTSEFSIGQNNEGVDIMALRVSTNPTASDPRKIGYLVVGTHHGNEGQAPVFTLFFAQQLLKRYTGPELSRSNLAGIEWVILPVLNISGYNAGTREEYGIDPNRQYPGPCIANPATSLKSIQLMEQLLASRSFTGSVTVHGYANALTFPWGVDTTETHTNDQDVYERIFAKAASYNGYPYGTSTDVVYPCDGSFEDFVYWKYGIWSMLLELKDGSASDIASSEEAVYSFFSQLDSSPSGRNQMTGSCRARHPDLRTE
jgi:hypothetical protein